MIIEPTKKTTLGRTFALWFGAFTAIGLLLFFYGGVGLIPIFSAGLFTLVLTLFRYFRNSR